MREATKLSDYQKIRQILLDLVGYLKDEGGLENMSIAKLHFDNATDRLEAYIESKVAAALEELRSELPEMIPDRAERERLYAMFPEAKPWLASIRNEVLTQIHELIQAALKAQEGKDEKNR